MNNRGRGGKSSYGQSAPNADKYSDKSVSKSAIQQKSEPPQSSIKDLFDIIEQNQDLCEYKSIKSEIDRIKNHRDQIYSDILSNKVFSIALDLIKKLIEKIKVNVKEESKINLAQQNYSSGSGQISRNGLHLFSTNQSAPDNKVAIKPQHNQALTQKGPPYDVAHILKMFDIFEKCPVKSKYKTIENNVKKIRIMKDDEGCDKLITEIFPSVINIIKDVFEDEERKSDGLNSSAYPQDNKSGNKNDPLSGFSNQSYPNTSNPISQYSYINQSESNPKPNQTSNIDDRGRTSTRSSSHIPKRKSSVGLRNKGNTCYINSVLQMIAHLPISPETLGSDPLRVALARVINAMNRQESNIESCLASFLSALQNSSDFIVGEQGDPKYLIIHLFRKNPQLISWERQIEFNHTSSRGPHTVDFPIQIIKFFQVPSTSMNNYKSLLENTVRTTFFETGYSRGYCDKCNRDVEGTERIKKHEKAKILMFNFSTQNISIPISDVKTLTFGNATYELLCIIQRTGSQSTFGHNFCVCKEQNDEWIEYNDSNKQPLRSYNMVVPNSYILVYAEP